MRIVLGVSGGIAAYKAAEIARSLIRNEHVVQVVMTQAAQEFIRPLTFAALTGRKVITDLFSSGSAEATLSSSVEHIGVAREHDLLLVAPATANVIAKFAHGLADDFLSTLYLAFKGPVIIAPAMNNEMWDHAATRQNIQSLRKRGHRVVEPEDGYLACGTFGPGRLAETERIARAVEISRDLTNETVLITAGPTRERIDPVRYLSNRSSGKMGYALADAAAQRGAHVVLISGPVSMPPPAGVETVRIETAEQMYDAVFEHLESSTVIIKCAAVADYRPAAVAAQKIKKSPGEMTLSLVSTRDILAELGKRKGNRVLVGFAAETENLRENAWQKLQAKNCDMVILNHAQEAFDSDSNQVTLVLKNGLFEDLPRASKREIADSILDRIHS